MDSSAIISNGDNWQKEGEAFGNNRHENVEADLGCLGTERRTMEEGEILEWKHENVASRFELVWTHSVDG